MAKVSDCCSGDTACASRAARLPIDCPQCPSRRCRRQAKRWTDPLPRITRDAVFAAEAASCWRRSSSGVASQGNRRNLPPAYFLAISGGGDNGAYGAGFLNGWTATGIAARIQGRHRRQHRRADRALRVPRSQVRLRARTGLYDLDAEGHFQEARNPQGASSATGWRTLARSPRRSRPTSIASCSTQSRPNMRKAGFCLSERPTSTRWSPSSGT